MTLRYEELDTPFGRMLAVSRDGALVRLTFPEEDPDTALERVSLELGEPTSRGALKGLAGQLDAYLAGRRRVLEIPWSLDLVAPGFGRRVLEATATIPYGSVATYGEIAARAGSRRGARAAGNALNRNPVPIVVPCHRVVPATGGIGGYGGREDRKATLLTLEGAIRPGATAGSA